MTDIVTLDVRDMIARGEAPLQQIEETAEALTPGQRLRLLAPFRPMPLFRLMEQMGFAYDEKPLDGDGWEIEFYRPADAVALENGSSLAAADWPAPVRELDLTGQVPPVPLVRILAALGGCKPGEVVFAVLDRKPDRLIDELTRRGHDWAGNHTADGTAFRILIRCGA